MYAIFLCSLIAYVVMGQHLIQHGDGVKDIAFSVEDCRGIVEVRILLKIHRIHTIMNSIQVA